MTSRYPLAPLEMSNGSGKNVQKYKQNWKYEPEQLALSCGHSQRSFWIYGMSFSGLLYKCPAISKYKGKRGMAPKAKFKNLISQLS